MLYKKYHRNFIRWFKKGTKFEYFVFVYGKEIMFEVVGKPFISSASPLSIDVSVTKSGISDLPGYLLLIYLNGRLGICIENIKFIENAV